MQQTGRLATWNDDRGFGFIDTDEGERVFVHIKSIARLATRPRIGDQLRFDLGLGRDGRPAAVNVRVLGANPVDPAVARRGLPPPAPRPLTGRRLLRLALLAILAVALVLAMHLGGLPTWFGWLYLGMGLLSGLAYFIDKRRAEADEWRIPETNLHTLDLIFGIGGGLAAQAAFNHKVSKPGHSAVSISLTVLHIAALCSFAAGLVVFPPL